MTTCRRILLAAAALGSGACAEPDDATDADSDSDSDADADCGPDVVRDPEPGCDPGGGCTPFVDDFAPGDADDPYDACLADDGDYHPLDPASVPTIARVAAFEAIADLLWRGGPLDTTDFEDAAEEYAPTDGLESRVTRREDEHHPACDAGVCQDLATGWTCGDPLPADLAACADRCVGPARIQPILCEAFLNGIAGEGVARIHSARIEAGLLWFLYVSTYKECATCSTDPANCDSCFAYYGGGRQRAETPLGLAAYVSAIEAATHGRAFDGVLANDCWDEVDPDRAREDLHGLALAQLDRALLRGLALVVKGRLEAWAASDACEDRAVAWAFVSILGPVVDREIEARGCDPIAWDADPFDAEAATCALATCFRCP